MGHIFVSYAHEDEQLAARTADALARVQLPFFIDSQALSPGDSLWQKIGDGLDQAAGVVALLSKHSINSTWVRRELTAVAERGTRVIPVRCDDSVWPSALALTIGDALYIGGSDWLEIIGRLPKTFHDRLPQCPAGSAGQYFKLSYRQRSPYARFFTGTVQTALEAAAFGRACVVVPTDMSVDLSGKVTTSVLEYLNVDRQTLEPRRERISSRNVCDLGLTEFNGAPVHLVASTVFNDQGRLCAEDQWRAAGAVLDKAKELQCATVLVPPMGVGAYGWPPGAALQHWLFGVIRWVARNPLVTEDAPWPIICGPGIGAQRMFQAYLDRLDVGALKRLSDGYFQFPVEWKQATSSPTSANHDAMVGSVVAQAWMELRGRRDLIAMHESSGRRGRGLTYDLGTPLNKTVFADLDIIKIVDREGQ